MLFCMELVSNVCMLQVYCTTTTTFVTGKDKLADILNIHPSHAKELMESFLGILMVT